MSDFQERRAHARKIIDNELDDGTTLDERKAFFDAVYDRAEGDAAFVPWADMAPKAELLGWLADNPAGDGQRALDVACGLGDNAEALAQAGYETYAFDLSQQAIDWAKERFPTSKVRYEAADLFALPDGWAPFDLVHECYTVQSLPEGLRDGALDAIAACVAPGGTLLVYARTRTEGSPAEHAPWPLMPSEIQRFDNAGLERLHQVDFDVERGERIVPHSFIVYRRPA